MTGTCKPQRYSHPPRPVETAVWKQSAARVGVLGGTFDPIHNGHLEIARVALHQLELDGILFIPTGSPWLRDMRPLATRHQRLKMTRLGIRGERQFSVSDLETHREGPTYTIDTLSLLRQQVTADTEILFIVGEDAAHSIPNWHEPKKFLASCSLVVIERPDVQGFDLQDLDAMHPGSTQRTAVIKGLGIGISGTEVRRRCAAGLTLAGWVPQEVERYIVQNKLYGMETTR
jgi:nicotinate-nucleotide adenylyltransferase